MRVDEPYTECMTSRLLLSSCAVVSSPARAALELRVDAVRPHTATRARPIAQNSAMRTAATLMQWVKTGLTA